jgi:hypothetical protein
VRSQLAAYVGAEEGQVTVEAPPSRSPEAAQNLGLALHNSPVAAVRRVVPTAAFPLPGTSRKAEQRHRLRLARGTGPQGQDPPQEGLRQHGDERNLARSLDAEVSMDFDQTACAATS